MKTREERTLYNRLYARKRRAKEKLEKAMARSRVNEMAARLEVTGVITPPSHNRTSPIGEGAPTGITVDDVRRTKMLQFIRLGVHPEIACVAAGIALRTLVNWRKLAKDPEAHASYREMIQSIDDMEAQAESELVLRVYRSDPKWVLERRFRKRYTRTDKIQVTGVGDGPVEVNHSSPADELKRRLDEIAARASTTPIVVVERPSLPAPRARPELPS